MLKLGIIGSGAGSNMLAIHRAIQNGVLDAEIVLVLSDHEEAGILAKAKAAGLPCEVIDCTPYKQKFLQEVQEKTAELLKKSEVDLVCLAGFMRIVGEPLLRAYGGKMLNIHPSLLPAYPGLMAWKQAIEDGTDVSGCTVHLVDGGMDTGEIILQKEVPVLLGDTAETLHQRIQMVEHEAYPEAIRMMTQLEK